MLGRLCTGPRHGGIKPQNLFNLDRVIGREGHTVGSAGDVWLSQHINRAGGPGQEKLLPVARAAGRCRAGNVSIVIVSLAGSGPAGEVVVG